jgi:hypothetical protein
MDTDAAESQYQDLQTQLARSLTAKCAVSKSWWKTQPVTFSRQAFDKYFPESSPVAKSKTGAMRAFLTDPNELANLIEVETFLCKHTKRQEWYGKGASCWDEDGNFYHTVMVGVEFKSTASRWIATAYAHIIFNGAPALRELAMDPATMLKFSTHTITHLDTLAMACAALEWSLENIVIVLLMGPYGESGSRW